MLGIAARAGEVDASDPPSTVLLPRLSSSMDDAPAPVTSLYVLLSEPSLLQAHSALQGERLRHLSWICFEGAPVEVYGATSAVGRATGYIEAKEGAAFTVHLRDDRVTPANDTCMFLILYGVK